MRLLPAVLLTLSFPLLVHAQEAAPEDPVMDAEVDVDEVVTPPDRETRLQAAALYSRSRSGLSLIVQEHGEIVFEEYTTAGGADRATELASGTKSFWGVVAMCAVHDGLLTLDELAADTITEWKEDERKSRITVRRLLDLSSGLATASDALRGGRGVYDRYQYAVESVPATREPGETFEYGPSHFFAFGELLRRKLLASDSVTATTPYDYLAARVLTPIGVEPSQWRRDRKGNETIPYGALLTAREWTRFGQFVLDGGHAGEVEILPKKLLDQCFEPSAANPTYGLTWWLGHREGESELPNDIVYAAGLGKQRLYVIPSRHLVIVRQAPLADDSGLEWSDAEFLGLLLNGRFPGPDDAAVAVSQRVRARQVLDALDANDDGVLDVDEVRGVMRRAFRRIDTDGSGGLDLDELTRAVRAMRR